MANFERTTAETYQDMSSSVDPTDHSSDRPGPECYVERSERTVVLDGHDNGQEGSRTRPRTLVYHRRDRPMFLRVNLPRGDHELQRQESDDSLGLVVSGNLYETNVEQRQLPDGGERLREVYSETGNSVISDGVNEQSVFAYKTDDKNVSQTELRVNDYRSLSGAEINLGEDSGVSGSGEQVRVTRRVERSISVGEDGRKNEVTDRLLERRKTVEVDEQDLSGVEARHTSCFNCEVGGTAGSQAETMVSEINMIWGKTIVTDVAQDGEAPLQSPSTGSLVSPRTDSLAGSSIGDTVESWSGEMSADTARTSDSFDTYVDTGDSMYTSPDDSFDEDADHIKKDGFMLKPGFQSTPRALPETNVSVLTASGGVGPSRYDKDRSPSRSKGLFKVSDDIARLGLSGESISTGSPGDVSRNEDAYDDDPGGTVTGVAFSSHENKDLDDSDIFQLTFDEFSYNTADIENILDSSSGATSDVGVDEGEGQGCSDLPSQESNISSNESPQTSFVERGEEFLSVTNSSLRVVRQRPGSQNKFSATIIDISTNSGDGSAEVKSPICDTQLSESAAVEVSIEKNSPKTGDVGDDVEKNSEEGPTAVPQSPQDYLSQFLHGAEMDPMSLLMHSEDDVLLNMSKGQRRILKPHRRFTKGSRERVNVSSDNTVDDRETGHVPAETHGPEYQTGEDGKEMVTGEDVSDFAEGQIETAVGEHKVGDDKDTQSLSTSGGTGIEESIRYDYEEKNWGDELSIETGLNRLEYEDTDAKVKSDLVVYGHGDSEAIDNFISPGFKSEEESTDTLDGSQHATLESANSDPPELSSENLDNAPHSSFQEHGKNDAGKDAELRHSEEEVGQISDDTQRLSGIYETRLDEDEAVSIVTHVVASCEDGERGMSRVTEGELNHVIQYKSDTGETNSEEAQPEDGREKDPGSPRALSGGLERNDSQIKNEYVTGNISVSGQRSEGNEGGYDGYPPKGIGAGQPKPEDTEAQTVESVNSAGGVDGAGAEVDNPLLWPKKGKKKKKKKNKKNKGGPEPSVDESSGTSVKPDEVQEVTRGDGVVDDTKNSQWSSTDKYSEWSSSDKQSEGEAKGNVEVDHTQMFLQSREEQVISAPERADDVLGRLELTEAVPEDPIVEDITSLPGGACSVDRHELFYDVAERASVTKKSATIKSKAQESDDQHNFLTLPFITGIPTSGETERRIHHSDNSFETGGGQEAHEAATDTDERVRWDTSAKDIASSTVKPPVNLDDDSDHNDLSETLELEDEDDGGRRLDRLINNLFSHADIVDVRDVRIYCDDDIFLQAETAEGFLPQSSLCEDSMNWGDSSIMFMEEDSILTPAAGERSVHQIDMGDATIEVGDKSNQKDREFVVYDSNTTKEEEDDEINVSIDRFNVYDENVTIEEEDDETKESVGRLDVYDENVRKEEQDDEFNESIDRFHMYEEDVRREEEDDEVNKRTDQFHVYDENVTKEEEEENINERTGQFHVHEENVTLEEQDDEINKRTDKFYLFDESVNKEEEENDIIESTGPLTEYDENVQNDETNTMTDQFHVYDEEKYDINESTDNDENFTLEEGDDKINKRTDQFHLYHENITQEEEDENVNVSTDYLYIHDESITIGEKDNETTESTDQLHVEKDEEDDDETNDNTYQFYTYDENVTQRDDDKTKEDSQGFSVDETVAEEEITCEPSNDESKKVGEATDNKVLYMTDENMAKDSLGVGDRGENAQHFATEEGSTIKIPDRGPSIKEDEKKGEIEADMTQTDTTDGSGDMEGNKAIVGNEVDEIEEGDSRETVGNHRDLCLGEDKNTTMDENKNSLDLQGVVTSEVEVVEAGGVAEMGEYGETEERRYETRDDTSATEELVPTTVVKADVDKGETSTLVVAGATDSHDDGKKGKKKKKKKKNKKNQKGYENLAGKHVVGDEDGKDVGNVDDLDKEKPSMPDSEDSVDVKAGGEDVNINLGAKSFSTTDGGPRTQKVLENVDGEPTINELSDNDGGRESGEYKGLPDSADLLEVKGSGSDANVSLGEESFNTAFGGGSLVVPYNKDQSVRETVVTIGDDSREDAVVTIGDDSREDAVVTIDDEVVTLDGDSREDAVVTISDDSREDAVVTIDDEVVTLDGDSKEDTVVTIGDDSREDAVVTIDDEVVTLDGDSREDAVVTISDDSREDAVVTIDDEVVTLDGDDEVVTLDGDSREDAVVTIGDDSREDAVVTIGDDSREDAVVTIGDEAREDAVVTIDDEVVTIDGDSREVTGVTLDGDSREDALVTISDDSREDAVVTTDVEVVTLDGDSREDALVTISDDSREDAVVTTDDEVVTLDGDSREDAVVTISDDSREDVVVTIDDVTEGGDSREGTDATLDGDSREDAAVTIGDDSREDAVVTIGGDSREDAVVTIDDEVVTIDADSREDTVAAIDGDSKEDTIVIIDDDSRGDTATSTGAVCEITPGEQSVDRKEDYLNIPIGSAFTKRLLDDVVSNRARAQEVAARDPEALLPSLAVSSKGGEDDEQQLTAGGHLLSEMALLETAAREQADSLRLAVAQQARYDAQLQELNAAISEAQGKLLASPSTASSVGALKQQMAEHNTLAAKIKEYQTAVNEVTEKSRELALDSAHLSPKLFRKHYLPESAYDDYFSAAQLQHRVGSPLPSSSPLFYDTLPTFELTSPKTSAPEISDDGKLKVGPSHFRARETSLPDAPSASVELPRQIMSPKKDTIPRPTWSDGAPNQTVPGVFAESGASVSTSGYATAPSSARSLDAPGVPSTKRAGKSYTSSPTRAETGPKLAYPLSKQDSNGGIATEKSSSALGSLVSDKDNRTYYTPSSSKETISFDSGVGTPTNASTTTAVSTPQQRGSPAPPSVSNMVERLAAAMASSPTTRTPPVGGRPTELLRMGGSSENLSSLPMSTTTLASPRSGSVDSLARHKQLDSQKLSPRTPTISPRSTLRDAGKQKLPGHSATVESPWKSASESNLAATIKSPRFGDISASSTPRSAVTQVITGTAIVKSPRLSDTQLSDQWASLDLDAAPENSTLDDTEVLTVFPSKSSPAPKAHTLPKSNVSNPQDDISGPVDNRSKNVTVSRPLTNLSPVPRTRRSLGVTNSQEISPQSKNSFTIDFAPIKAPKSPSQMTTQVKPSPSLKFQTESHSESSKNRVPSRDSSPPKSPPRSRFLSQMKNGKPQTSTHQHPSARARSPELPSRRTTSLTVTEDRTISVSAFSPMAVPRLTSPFLTKPLGEKVSVSKPTAWNETLTKPASTVTKPAPSTTPVAKVRLGVRGAVSNAKAFKLDGADQSGLSLMRSVGSLKLAETGDSETRERSSSFGTRVEPVGRPLGQGQQGDKAKDISWSTLQEQAQSKERELQAALQRQERYQQSVQQLTAKMERVSLQLADNPAHLAAPLETQWSEYKETLSEIDEIKAEIAEARNRGEQLMDVPDSEGARALQSTLTMLEDRFRSLQGLAEDKGRQLQEAKLRKERHTIERAAYEKRVSELRAWLEESQVRHSSLALPSDDPVHLQEQIDQSKDIQEEVNVRLRQVSDLALQCDVICEQEPPSQAEKLRNQLAKLQKELGDLKMATIEKQAQLRAAIKDSEKRRRERDEVDVNVARLQKWMSDTKEMTKPSEAAAFQQSDIHKELATDISKHRQLVRQLSDRRKKAGAPTAALTSPTDREVKESWQRMCRHLAQKKQSLEAILNTCKPGELTKISLHAPAKQADSAKQLEEVRSIMGEMGDTWHDLQTQLDEKNLSLDEALTFQQQYQSALQNVSSWLDLAQQQLFTVPSTTDEHMRHNENLQKQLKSLQAEVTSLGEQGDDLLTSVDPDSRELASSCLASLDARAQLLSGCAEGQASDLRRSEQAWRQYQDEVKELKTRLQDAQKLLLEHTPAGSTGLDARLDNSQKIEAQLKKCELQLAELRSKEANLTKAYPKGVFPSELAVLQSNYLDLNRRAMEKKAILQQSTSVQQQYEKMLKDYSAFLNTAQDKLRVDSISARDLNHLKQQLAAHKDFFSDLEVHQAMLTALADQCDTETKARLQSQHSSLMSLTYVLVDQASLHGQRLERLTRQWIELDEKYKRLTKVLASLKAQVPRPIASGDSLTTIQDKLGKYKRLQDELADERASVFEVVDKGKQILHSVNCPSLESAVTNLADTWVDLNTDLTHELKRTETLGDQLSLFEREAAVLTSWLAAAKMKLASFKQLSASDLSNIGAVRTKVEKLLEFRKEIESQAPLKDRVLKAGQQLLLNQNYDTRGLSERLDNYESEWRHLEEEAAKAGEFLHERQMDLMPSRQAMTELTAWINKINKSLAEDAQRRVKTVADIEVMVKKYKGYKVEVTSKQMTLDFVNQNVLAPQPEDEHVTHEKLEFAEKLGEVNKKWDKVIKDINDRLTSLESINSQWLEYEQALERLQAWFREQEDKVKRYKLIGHEVGVRQTLKDCKTLHQQLQAKQSEMSTVTSLGEKLIALSKESPGCQKSVQDSLDSLKDNWSHLEQQTKQLETLLTDMLGQWARYHTDLASLNQMLTQIEYALSQYTLIGGDIHTLRSQVDKLKALQREQQASAPHLESFSNLSSQLRQVCEPPVQLDLQKTVSDVQSRWKQVAKDLGERLSQFEKCLTQWQRYEDQYTNLLNWLDTHEMLCTSLITMRDDPARQSEALEKGKDLQQELDSVQSRLSQLYRLSDQLTGTMDPSTIATLTARQSGLEQRMMALRQVLQQHISALSEDLTMLGRFNQAFQVVEKFLSYADQILEPADPGKSDEETALKMRLEQLRQLLLLFNNNYVKLDDVNDLGYRLALKDADAKRLLDLNHHWQALYEDANERARTLQGHMLVQQDFTAKCEAWMTFLAHTESDLAREIKGNLRELQEQLRQCEQFESDMYSNQQILHAIISDGQKMMRAGEVEDVDEFQQKLQLLSEQWHSVMRRASQRRHIIESLIRQWQQFNSSSKQLRSWLQEKESAMTALQFDSDSLQVIRHLSERVKTTQHEFEVQEATFKKIHDLGASLQQHADLVSAQEIRDTLSDLERRWTRVFNDLTDRGSKLDGVDRKWLECEDDIEEILAWLQDIRKKLYADIPTTHDEIQADINTCRDIASTFASAEDKRTSLLARERSLARLVQTEDMNLLHQRTRLLNKQWEELRRQAALREHRLTEALFRWTNLGEHIRSLMDWIEKMEAKITTSRDMHVEDLLAKLENEYKKEMEEKEAQKHDIVAQGQQLMKVSSEIRASDIEQKILRLEDKWTHLVSVMDFRHRKLQETVLAVKQLDTSMRNLSRWLSQVESQLSGGLEFKDVGIQEIQAKLQDQQDLQEDIEQHSAGVSAVLNLCEVLLHDQDACPTQTEFLALQHAMKNLEKRWRNICNLSPRRRTRVEETWELWQRFRKDCDRFSSWLSQIERDVHESEIEVQDVIAAKQEISKYESLQRNVHDHLGDLENINRQYRQLAKDGRTDTDGQLKVRMTDLNNRWDAVQIKVTEIMKKLRHSATIRQDFEETRTSLIAWLTDVDNQLDDILQLSSLDLESKVLEIRKIEDEIHTKRHRMEYLDQAGVYLMQKGDSQEALTVQAQLDDFRQFSGQVLEKVVTTQLQLERMVVEKQVDELDTAQAEKLRHQQAEDKVRELRDAQTTVILERQTAELERYLEESPPESPPVPRRREASPSKVILPSSRHTHSPVRSVPKRSSSPSPTRTLSRTHPSPSAAKADDLSVRSRSPSKVITPRTKPSGSPVRRMSPSPSRKPLPSTTRKGKSVTDGRASPRPDLGQLERSAKLEVLMEQLVESLDDCNLKLARLEQALGSGIGSFDSQLQMLVETEVAVDGVTRLHRLLKTESGVTSIASADAQVHLVVQRWERLQRRAMEREPHGTQKRQDLARLAADVEAMLAWLSEAEALQDSLRILPQDIGLLDRAVRQYKDFMVQLDSRKPTILSINLLSRTHLTPRGPETKSLRQKVQEMNRRWELVLARAEEIQIDIQSSLLRCDEFQASIDQYQLWLEGLENKVRQLEPLNLNQDEAALWTKYTLLVDILSELQRNQSKVVSLKETADQLLINSNAPSLCTARDSMHSIHKRMRSLMHLTTAYISSLEGKLNIYPKRSSASSSLDSEGRTSGLGSSHASRSSTPLRPMPVAHRSRARSPFAVARQLLAGIFSPLYGHGTIPHSDNSNIDSRSPQVKQTTAAVAGASRPSRLMRVIRAALPIQLLLLMLLLLACLIPVCEDEYNCMLRNNLRNSLSPMLRYTDGAPPT